MTLQDVLKACSSGAMPKVVWNGKVGQVETIKSNYIGHRGVAVKFLDYDYDIWFHDSDDSDKRSKYMRDLKFTDDI